MALLRLFSCHSLGWWASGGVQHFVFLPLARHLHQRVCRTFTMNRCNVMGLRKHSCCSHLVDWACPAHNSQRLVPCRLRRCSSLWAHSNDPRHALCRGAQWEGCLPLVESLTSQLQAFVTPSFLQFTIVPKQWRPLLG